MKKISITFININGQGNVDNADVALETYKAKIMDTDLIDDVIIAEPTAMSRTLLIYATPENWLIYTEGRGKGLHAWFKKELVNTGLIADHKETVIDSNVNQPKTVRTLLIILNTNNVDATKKYLTEDYLPSVETDVRNVRITTDLNTVTLHAELIDQYETKVPNAENIAMEYRLHGGTKVVHMETGTTELIELGCEKVV